MRHSEVRALKSCILLLLVAGCGPGGRPTVETAEVSGAIQLDGQPLSDAQVNFLNDDYAGVATTDESGRFQMEAQPGENTVYIVKYEGVEGTFDETMIGPSDQADGGGPKQLLPEKYSDPNESELSFNVPEDGTTEADFDLSRN